MRLTGVPASLRYGGWVLLACLLATLEAGCDRSEPLELKVSEQAHLHIEERHVRTDLFTYKSKFVEGFDYRAMIGVVFENGIRREEFGGRYVFDYDTGERVGRAGQTALRLVTESDGTVVTFYPIFTREVSR